MRPMHSITHYLKSKGYDCRSQYLGTRKKEFITITSPAGRSLTVRAECPLYPFVSASIGPISKDKQVAYDYMHAAGLAVPETLVVTRKSVHDIDIASLLVDGRVCVVKPNDRARSLGLTLDICTPEALRTALGETLEMAPVALVQSQFVGQEVRLTVINRKIRSALLRQKPQVIGDGKTTVKNLIEQENGARRALQHVQTPYPVLDDSLVPLDLLQSTVVPAIGEVVELSKSTMIRGGASMYEILPEVHSSYIQAVESAIQGLGDGFFVVDLMVASYSQAATPDNYIFLEMNLAPALTLYYSCRDSDHFPIVEDYLGPMLERVLGEHISYQTPALHYSVAS